MQLRKRLPLRSLLTLLVLPGGLVLSGCQTQADAVSAAQQMAATSATLQAYYGSLGALSAKTEEAQVAQSYLTGVPLDDETRTQLHNTRAEMKKRAEMAGTIARLSAIFADITNTGAASDAARAAGDLNTELVAIKAIKANSSETEALKMAVTAVVNVVKTHDEVRAARLIKPLAANLSAFSIRKRIFTNWLRTLTTSRQPPTAMRSSRGIRLASASCTVPHCSRSASGRRLQIMH